MAPLTFQRRCEFISLALHATRVKNLSRVVPIAWGAPWRGLVRARPLSYQRRHYLEQSRAAARPPAPHPPRPPPRIAALRSASKRARTLSSATSNLLRRAASGETIAQAATAEHVEV